MLDFIAKGLAKVFGTKSDRDVKELSPKVPLLMMLLKNCKVLVMRTLRAKTGEIKASLMLTLKPFDDKIAAFREKINALAADKVHEKDALFTEIEKTENQGMKLWK
jgi:preprotein translocase subunit SecA